MAMRMARSESGTPRSRGTCDRGLAASAGARPTPRADEPPACTGGGAHSLVGVDLSLVDPPPQRLGIDPPAGRRPGSQHPDGSPDHAVRRPPSGSPAPEAPRY